ncbi:MAG: hypothetical protein HY327_09350 [Chloroflexi bacterium]|nr:hypothetical protein [Chloroflexota bacterium]
MEYYAESNERAAPSGVPKSLLLIGIAFAVTLAVVVGNRLSNDSMAVLVGALCGISASIPACVALIIAMNRNWGRGNVQREEPAAYPNPYRQPPVIFVAPPQAAPNAFTNTPYFLPPQLNDGAYPTRDFKIIGEE